MQNFLLERISELDRAREFHTASLQAIHGALAEVRRLLEQLAQQAAGADAPSSAEPTEAP